MFGYLIDMDGVIYHDNQLIPGANRFIQELCESNVPFMFLTNNSQRTWRDVVTKLQRMGIEVSEEHVFTCAIATARFLARQKPNGTAYIIGEGGLLTALHSNGYSIVDRDPDYVVIGEGHARIGTGEIITGPDAMRQANIKPVALEAKEGLSLLNGTQGMLALLSLALRDADIATDTADVAAALSLDALRGSPGAFDSRIMHARAYAGASMTARNLAHLNEGSQIRESHRDSNKDPRVQDAYSLRCTPQVHGAVRDSLAQAREMAAVELNSATDNPLVFARAGNGKSASKSAAGDIISGGNFHGQPLAMAADQVAIALATLGGISERRIEQMTNPLTSMLPAFLTPEPGLNSGFMIAQVTAAALTSENKALATPHSVDSISTSGNQEDYVSMGMSGARRLNRMLQNLRHTIAIELLCAAQGIELLAPLQTGTLAKKAIATIRAASPKVVEDRPLAPDIESVTAKIADGTFSAILH